MASTPWQALRFMDACAGKLMKLTATDVYGLYEVQTPFVLPFHAGSLVRGLVGRALHGGPLYERLFAPLTPPGHPFLRAGTRAPPALMPVLTPPARRPLRVGDPLTIVLRVFGDLSDEDHAGLASALAALAALPIGDGGRVRSLGTTAAAPTRLTLDPAATRAGRLGLRFLTPTWLEEEQQPVAQLSAGLLVRAALRRLTSLCALYGEAPPRPQVDELLACAEGVRIRDQRLVPLRWQRESQERDERHELRGVLGEATLEGPVAPLLPLLRVAESIHLGKQTSMGLGRLLVSEVSDDTGVTP